MKTIARNRLLLAALSLTWACSSGNSPVDIGDGRTGEKLEDYAAVWEGYAEAYDFSDGSDHVKVTLDAAGNGMMEIGDSAPLPLPTDPNATAFGAKGDLVLIDALVPGASYPIQTATVEAARIRFTMNPWEVERDWCALQTSYPFTYVDQTLYACFDPNVVTHLGADDSNCLITSGPSAGTTLDCSKIYFCGVNPNVPALCSCDAQGCSVYDDPTIIGDRYAKFDAALSDAGNSLVGTLKITVDGQPRSMTVRLTRH